MDNVTDIENKLHQIWEYLSDGNYSNDNECVFDVARILHNELSLESGTIRGVVQRDWQRVYYIDDGTVDLDILGDWYFGNVFEVIALEDGDYPFGTTVTDTELWKIRNQSEEGMKKDFALLLDISPDEIGEIIETN